ncbi:SDR family oxidoreductase [Agrobacterium sp. MOPV5]|uniref:SDR family NAD(P)-dependent oxidoreductase n=1 Tax=Agrobacterium leguminum TaxID=2792015 RepID=UPI0018C1E73B|nr:SDR family NAD(P)-dependent oxidoreductase [Agrobacterium leguminum]MBG0511011.1 SDR family oxidoreductase [Agrobacterium leguminum]
MLNGKIVIVTGGASPRGIGRATARLLAAQGAAVAIIDLDEGKAQEAAAELGDKHRGYGCDVTDPEACKTVIGRIESDFSDVFGILTFAGISRSTPFFDVSSDEFDAVMACNVKGTMNICQAAMPLLVRNGEGSIVLVGSIAAQRGGGIFGATHYSASKGAVQSLAKAMAREFGPKNIRVNAIAPGLIETDIFEGKLTEERKTDIAATIPMRRVGQPVDVAGVCAFLMSDWSNYVTGVTLDINGGLHIH